MIASADRICAPEEDVRGVARPQEKSLGQGGKAGSLPDDSLLPAGPELGDCQSRPLCRDMPAAGPHAKPWLLNPDATPGTGALPTQCLGDEVDPAID
jgi:hypothetical protein